MKILWIMSPVVGRFYRSWWYIHSCFLAFDRTDVYWHLLRVSKCSITQPFSTTEIYIISITHHLIIIQLPIHCVYRGRRTVGGGNKLQTGNFHSLGWKVESYTAWNILQQSRHFHTYTACMGCLQFKLCSRKCSCKKIFTCGFHY